MANVIFRDNARYAVQFVAPDGRRKTISLGKVSRRTANEVRGHVTALEHSARCGASPDQRSLTWLLSIGEDLQRKLCAAGLAEPRLAGPTLAEYLAKYQAMRADVAESSRTHYRYVADRLMAFFGAGRRLSEITAGDARRFDAHLRGERGYAPATAGKTITTARLFFKLALLDFEITYNPFDGLKAGAQTNRERVVFVDRPTVARVLDACPDAEWRLLVALARYGGLRNPSETLLLKWADILEDRFRVTSPKTRGKGKPERMVPIFPELRPYLDEAWEAAPEGAVYVITRYRGTPNLRTELARFVRLAGLVPWPRLFQNLRASRATELADQYPMRVVTDWLGHTPHVSHTHYLSTTEEHFRRAARGAAEPAGNNEQQVT